MKLRSMAGGAGTGKTAVALVGEKPRPPRSEEQRREDERVLAMLTAGRLQEVVAANLAVATGDMRTHRTIEVWGVQAELPNLAMAVASRVTGIQLGDAIVALAYQMSGGVLRRFFSVEKELVPEMAKCSAILGTWERYISDNDRELFLYVRGSGLCCLLMAIARKCLMAHGFTERMPGYWLAPGKFGTDIAIAEPDLMHAMKGKASLIIEKNASIPSKLDAILQGAMKDG